MSAFFEKKHNDNYIVENMYYHDMFYSQLCIYKKHALFLESDDLWRLSMSDVIGNRYISCIDKNTC